MPDLFLGSIVTLKRRKLMDVIDKLNSYYGRNTVFYGAAGIKGSWKARSERKSQNYTEWNGLAIVWAV
jgi:Domain of unknown function (DUF4113)